MRGKTLASAWLVLILVAAACTSGAATNSGTGATNPPPTQSSSDDSADTNSSAGSPADGARAFMETFLSGEDASPYLCEIVNTQDDVMISPLPNMAGVEASIDASGLVYTVNSESGDTAEVSVSGKAVLTMTVQEQDTVQDIDYDASPLIFNMKNEDGWKVCT